MTDEQIAEGIRAMDHDVLSDFVMKIYREALGRDTPIERMIREEAEEHIEIDE